VIRAITAIRVTKVLKVIKVRLVQWALKEYQDLKGLKESQVKMEMVPILT
jgi:hypothetical protein